MDMSAQRSVGCHHGLRRGVGGMEGKLSMVGYHAVCEGYPFI